jgi:hypothetical protein
MIRIPLPMVNASAIRLPLPCPAVAVRKAFDTPRHLWQGDHRFP